MKRSIQDTQIVFIGSGNLATNMAKALYHQGFRILQIYSRTAAHARLLADKVEAEWTDSLESVSNRGEIYIVSLTDEALVQLMPQIVKEREDKLFIHTAGSVSLDIWQGYAQRYGVIYPMQTFSKQVEVDFTSIPVFIEANNVDDHDRMDAIARTLSQKVYDATSEQRKILHLAAVFTCNFSNHLFALAAKLLKQHGLPFDVMLPLIDETARKVHQLPPALTQTGPAIRNDEGVMRAHLDMLKDEPVMREIYEKMSQSIHQLNK